jgi:hypothetical protein
MLTAKDDAALAGSVRAMDALVSRLRAKIAIIDGLRSTTSRMTATTISGAY